MNPCVLPTTSFNGDAHKKPGAPESWRWSRVSPH